MREASTVSGGISRHNALYTCSDSSSDFQLHLDIYLPLGAYLDNMERALVVTNGPESETELVREAGELAGGVGASLVVCSVVDRNDIDQVDETIEAIERSERTSYGTTPQKGLTRKLARDIADEALDNTAVEYETTGIVADIDDCATEIVELATELGCDHVFITGRHRSPTGKAVFGDTAQQVILNFPHPVTVYTSSSSSYG